MSTLLGGLLLILLIFVIVKILKGVFRLVLFFLACGLILWLVKALFGVSLLALLAALL